jgi:hypothetical protein
MQPTLQTSTIKSIFSTFDHEQQIDLLYELMKLGNVDSIIQTTTRPRIRVQGIDGDPEIYNNPTYSQTFNYWIYKFLPTHFTVIDNVYLDRCLHFFEIVTSKKTRRCNCSTGNGYCRAKDINAENFEIVGEEETMRMANISDFIASEIPYDVHICATFKDEDPDTLHRITMSFEDLFVLVYHRSDDEINILLLIMGFFNDNPSMLAVVNWIVQSKYAEMLNGRDSPNHRDAIRLFPDLSWRTWKPAYVPAEN